LVHCLGAWAVAQAADASLDLENTMRTPLPGLLPLLVCAGCASSLRTYNGELKQTKGIAVRVPILAEVTRVTTYALVGGDATKAMYCTPDTVVTLESIPIGEEYFISFDPAKFGKAEFSVELTDGGTLRKVSLGSDPGTSSAVEAATGLISAVLPFIAVPKQQPEPVGPSFERRVGEEGTTSELRQKHCAKAKTDITDIQKAKPR